MPATAMPAQNALATYRDASQTGASASASTWKNGSHPRVCCSQCASAAACGITRKNPHSPQMIEGTAAIRSTIDTSRGRTLTGAYSLM